jgi:hypothetical protein
MQVSGHLHGLVCLTLGSQQQLDIRLVCSRFPVLSLGAVEKR